MRPGRGTAALAPAGRSSTLPTLRCSVLPRLRGGCRPGAAYALACSSGGDGRRGAAASASRSRGSARAGPAGGRPMLAPVAVLLRRCMLLDLLCGPRTGESVRLGFAADSLRCGECCGACAAGCRSPLRWCTALLGPDCAECQLRGPDSAVCRLLCIVIELASLAVRSLGRPRAAATAPLGRGCPAGGRCACAAACARPTEAGDAPLCRAPWLDSQESGGP